MKHRSGVLLAIVGVTSALLVAGSGVVATAGASTNPVLSDSQKLDKILRNTEEIKRKLGITSAPKPTTTRPTTAHPTTTIAPTTVAPTTTTATVAPTTTTVAPSPGGTAAGNFGWGLPIAAASDEFNGATIDTSKWGLPDGCWSANSTVMRGRCGDHDSIGGGTFKETGTSDGKTGYLSAHAGFKYQRVEARMRITTSGSGGDFHPVLLLWPDSEKWPSGGEEDWIEVDGNDTHLTAFMHHPDGSQDEFTSGPIDIHAWHNYGFEWTASGLTGYVDGVKWFTDTKSSAQPPGPMHQTIQLDNFVGSGMRTTIMELDWLRTYAV